jgi:hypothetical protein
MGLGADLSAPPAPTPRGPGRPPANPAARAASDAKYAAMQELMAAMPTGAKEGKFAIFQARRRVDAKRTFEALTKINLTKWVDSGFNDSESGALAAYCEEQFGSGRYLIEAQDAHGMRLPALATWVISTPNSDGEDMDDDFDDEEDDRPRRGGRRFTSRHREDDEEDPRESRHNIADVLVASARSDKSATKDVMKSSTDMLTMMMITSQQAADRAEERKREERAEERRREERQAEIKREEDRRRDAEEARRREEDARRREDEAKRRDDENRRREEENRRLIESSNKRTEILITTLTAAATTLLPAFLNRRDPAQEALVASLGKKEPDPMSLMLLKTFLDNKTQTHSPLEHVIPTLIEATKAGNQMQAEAMRSAFSMNNEITATIIKRVLDNADSGGGGGGGGGGSMLEQIMGALKGAGELVGTLMPKTPPQPPQQYVQAAQRRLPPPAAAPAAAAAVPAAAATPAAPVAAAPVEAQPTAEQIAKEEAEFQAAVAANPLIGSLVGLRAIQQGHSKDQVSYQQTVEYVVQHLPLSVRVYILDNNEAQVLGSCLPTVQANPALMEWFKDPAVLPWIRDYVPKLAPMIEAMFGPAQQQRDQFVEEIAKFQAAQATPPAADVAPVQPVAEAAAAPAPEGAPAHEASPMPPEAAPEQSSPVQSSPVQSNVIPGPGASPTEPPHEAPPAAPASHLDADV